MTRMTAMSTVVAMLAVIGVPDVLVVLGSTSLASTLVCPDVLGQMIGHGRFWGV